jgi:hypothetical protein
VARRGDNDNIKIDLRWDGAVWTGLRRQVYNKISTTNLLSRHLESKNNERFITMDLK